MKRRLMALAAALVLATPLPAQDMGADGAGDNGAQAGGAQAGIEATISSQLEAFNDRDVEEAWTYASPGIQRLFGNAGNFGMMVQQGYPMVWTNSEARFLELREIGGRLWQKVMIRDANGGLHVLDYAMIQTESGWQIDGVQILPAPDLGV